MKTYIFNLNNIPTSEDLIGIVGYGFYKSYEKLCKTIEILLEPEIEKWDDAGRRGRYYHGYVTKNFLVDIYIIKNGLIKCEVDLPRFLFSKLQKLKDNFSADIKKSIDMTLFLNKQYGRFNLSLILNSESAFDEVEKIIKTLSDSKEIR